MKYSIRCVFNFNVVFENCPCGMDFNLVITFASVSGMVSDLWPLRCTLVFWNEKWSRGGWT